MAKLDWYIRANLKPRHMQLLVGLDELRHFGRVADMMNVSQPAISKALAEIERGVGLTLFERGKNGLVPTVYGECLIRLCRSMLHDLNEAGEQLRQLQSGAVGRVRIGVLPVAAPVIVPRAVMRLQQEFPLSVVVLHEGTGDRLLPMLREGAIDVIVGTLPPASMSAGLEVRTLHAGEGVAVVCGSRHPLAARDALTAADLDGLPLVIPPLGTLFRSAVDRVLDELGLPLLHARIESGSITAGNTLLRESEVVGFYAPHLAHHYARMGWLKILPIATPPTSVPIGCAWLKHVQPNAPTRAFISLVEEVATQALGPAPEMPGSAEDA
jgi:DNA-binding transcriptional LysR family regulator